MHLKIPSVFLPDLLRRWFKCAALFVNPSKRIFYCIVYWDFPHKLSIHWFNKINLISKYFLKVKKSEKLKWVHWYNTFSRQWISAYSLLSFNVTPHILDQALFWHLVPAQLWHLSSEVFCVFQMNRFLKINICFSRI